MASIADMLVSSTLEKAGKAPDISGAITQGAQLASHIEQMKMQRQQLEAKKQEAELAKYEKVAGWIETAAKMPEGKPKQAFLRNFVPNGVKSLGLADKIDPTVFEMIQGDPQLGSFLVAQIRDGKVTPQILNSPDGLATLAASPEYQQFGGEEALKGAVDYNRAELDKAYADRTQQEATRTNAIITAEGQAQRAIADDARAGQVELAKKIAQRYTDYAAGGGRAAITSSLAKLDDAAKALENGAVRTGGTTTKIPGFKSDDVQSMLNPKMVEMKTQAQGALNSVLRQTLGAQFTEQEGVRVLSQVWDDRQSPAVNAKKIRAKIQELRQTVRDQEAEYRRFGYLSQEKKSASDTSAWKKVLAGQKAAVLKLKPEDQNRFITGLATQLGIDAEAVKKELGIK